MDLTDSQRSTPKPQPGKRGLPFLLVIGLFGVGLGFIINILDPFILTEKVRLLAPSDLKNTVLGFLTILMLLAALVAQPVVGWLSDRTRSRWGRRAPYLTAGAIGVGLALGLIVIADGLWLLVVAVMLLSTASNTTQGAWQALIPDQVPETQHGLAVGFKTLAELVGVVAGVAVVGTTLARGVQWAAPLAGIGLFFAILIITLYVLGQTGEFRSSRSDRAEKPTNLSSGNHLSIRPYALLKMISLRFRVLSSCVAKQSGVSKGARWNHRTQVTRTGDRKSVGLRGGLSFITTLVRQAPAAFPWWMLNRFLFWSAGIAFRTFMLNYMEDVLAISPAEVRTLSSRFFLMLGTGILLLALPAGAVADRLGRRPLLIAAGLLAASGAMFFVFLRELNLLFVGAGLVAVGAGIFASASWALVTDLAPDNEGAQYLALANVATVLGSIGGRLGGPLIDGVNRLTGTTSTGYLIVFCLVTLFFAASSVTVLKMGQKPNSYTGRAAAKTLNGP